MVPTPNVMPRKTPAGSTIRRNTRKPNTSKRRNEAGEKLNATVEAKLHYPECHLIKAGFPAEHIAPVEEALRNGIINGTPLEAYAEAFNILTDEDTVNGILARLNDELTAGLEAIKNLKTELESENTHE